MALIARTAESEIDEHDHEGRTALMMAARDGHGSLVMELVRKRANVNKQDRYARQLIHVAFVMSGD
eukprot:1188848-Rhodomonas_salina.3